MEDTTIVGVSSGSSSSSRGFSSSGDTSSESVATSDGKDASVINLDEAGWSDMCPAVYMLSELEEFELEDLLVAGVLLLLGNLIPHMDTGVPGSTMLITWREMSKKAFNVWHA